MTLDFDLPLQGKIVVVTRAQSQQAVAQKLFTDHGAKVLDLPALIIGPPDDWRPLDNALKTLSNFHWIIFSSSNGVEAVENRLQLMGKNISWLSESLKIAAVGRKTATSLENLGAIVDFIPPDYVADSLIADFPVSLRGLNILLPRVQTGGRTILAESFRLSGAEALEISAYESRCPKEIPKVTIQYFLNRKVDAITFTSGKTVANTAHLLLEEFGDNWRNLIDGVKIISIGPQTTIACKKYLYRINKEAYPYDIDGLLNACIEIL